MQLFAALGLRDREFVSLVGADERIALMFAIAHEIAAIPKRVVTTATIRFRVPSPDQCEACVADAIPEVAYRDTIERLKYFTHVHTGLGGSGGFVTTRTDNIGRFYKPSTEALTLALGRNGSLPYILACGAAWTAPPTAGHPTAVTSRSETDEPLPNDPRVIADSVPTQATILIPVIRFESTTDGSALDASIAATIEQCRRDRPGVSIAGFLSVGEDVDPEESRAAARRWLIRLGGPGDETSPEGPSRVVVATEQSVVEVVTA